MQFSQLNALLSKGKVHAWYWLWSRDHWLPLTLERFSQQNDQLQAVFIAPATGEFITLAVTLAAGGCLKAPGLESRLAESSACSSPRVLLEDLSQLSLLNEPEVVANLVVRYQTHNIYSYCGIVLVALNPFAEECSSLYAPQIMRMYWEKTRAEVGPHLFVVAEEAFQMLQQNGQSQCILVSGESGAGKTVSARHIISYLVERTFSCTDGAVIEKRILASSPVLEAFGNAKTLRNDNSSRFGKFIQLFFKEGQIAGARIETFLLEKSRVTTQKVCGNNWNFHIFYLMLSSAEMQAKYHLLLNHAEQHPWIPRETAAIPEHLQLTQLLEAFTQCALSVSEQEWVFATLAAIFHLGLVSVQGNEDESAVEVECEHLKLGAAFLGVSEQSLAVYFTSKPVRSDRAKLSQAAARNVRDSFCRAVYASLFDWLVTRINCALDPEGNCSAAAKPLLHISVLDIYGFECFESNGFEQFCINYANEKLQQEFVNHSFQLERDAFESEGIEWPSNLDFASNQPCIDLIEGKLGILSLLDEQSKFPTATDASFVRKVMENNAPSKSGPLLEAQFSSYSVFGIKHYAETIWYNAQGFLERNKDQIMEFALPHPLGTLVPKRTSLSFRFKESLSQLMSIVYGTKTHYIRCIKPNKEKAPFEYSLPLVCQQLRACGIIESIKIYSQGFPSKMLLGEFDSRYHILEPGLKGEPLIRTIITQGEDAYRIGKTQIFIKAGIIAALDREAEMKMWRIVCAIQSAFKQKIASVHFTGARIASIVVQREHRKKAAWILRIEQKYLKAANIFIRTVRMWIARQAFAQLKSLSIAIQRSFIVTLRLVAVKGYQVTCIANQVRRIRALHKMQKNLSALIQIQSIARLIDAKEKLIALKAETKSLDVIQQKFVLLQRRYLQKAKENDALTSLVSSLLRLNSNLITSLAHKKTLIQSKVKEAFLGLSSRQRMDSELIEPLLTSSQTVSAFIEADSFVPSKFMAESCQYLENCQYSQSIDFSSKFFAQVVQILDAHSPWIVNCRSYLEQGAQLMFNRIVAEYSNAIVPTGALCMVNCQSLAGYVTSGQLGTGKKNDQNTPDFDTWLINLDALVASCKQCHISAPLCIQVFQAIMHNLCCQSLNIMLAGRDYCNWRRGMQIQYNISRLLEWTRDSLILDLYPCQSPRVHKKTSDVCAFEKLLEPLLQAAKLVQLSGELFADFEAVVGSVATQLNPAQIVRIMSQVEHVDQQVVAAFARANVGGAGGEIYREWEKEEWKCEIDHGEMLGDERR